MKNYYEILEVDKHASTEVINKAYKILAKRYHPDMHEENKKEWAEEKFKAINKAYEEVKKVGFDNAYFRKDIGLKAMKITEKN